jgi:hypothetical protein
MLAASVLALLLLSTTSLACEWGKSGKWNDAQRPTCYDHGSAINYTTVTGFFLQDDPATDPGTFDYVGHILRLCPVSNNFADDI